MIIKNKTNSKVESLKARLGLTGDVYMVGQNYIESLESHKRLIPNSTATTIEEAEQERLAYMEAERQRLVELAEQAERERQAEEEKDEKTEEKD